MVNDLDWNIMRPSRGYNAKGSYADHEPVAGQAILNYADMIRATRVYFPHEHPEPRTFPFYRLGGLSRMTWKAVAAENRVYGEQTTMWNLFYLAQKLLMTAYIIPNDLTKWVQPGLTRRMLVKFANQNNIPLNKKWPMVQLQNFLSNNVNLRELLFACVVYEEMQELYQGDTIILKATHGEPYESTWLGKPFDQGLYATIGDRFLATLEEYLWKNRDDVNEQHFPWNWADEKYGLDPTTFNAEHSMSLDAFTEAVNQRLLVKGTKSSITNSGYWIKRHYDAEQAFALLEDIPYMSDTDAETFKAFSRVTARRKNPEPGAEQEVTDISKEYKRLSQSMKDATDPRPFSYEKGVKIYKDIPGRWTYRPNGNHTYEYDNGELISTDGSVGWRKLPDFDADLVKNK